MLVSVIMPTYNSGRYIGQAVQSVLDQTLTDWELWIVDDCGTDNTREILQPHLAHCPQICYIRLNKNEGPAAARNAALRRAGGRYIAFLDSDDIWLPDKLEKQLAFMHQTGAPFSCTAYERMNENGESLRTACYPPPKTDYNRMLRLSNPIGNSTVIYDQETLCRYEVPPIKKRNDFALWLKILHDTPFCAGMPETLARYRVREGSVSGKKLAQARFHWQLYRQIEGLNALKSCWYMLCWATVKGTGIGLDRRKTQQ